MSTALVTGGAGFIGANLAHRLLGRGARVRIFDDLSRGSVERNVAWLRAQHGDRVELEVADIRDLEAVRAAVRGVDRVFHFAAQVAVTTSLVDPLRDFEINARGTLNVLTAIREQTPAPTLVYTSTNKVYGALSDVPLVANGTRWQPADAELARCGVGEARQLDFHSPYGCSKGAADAYVIDHARLWDLPAVVLRMSCIYGARQFGTEDQGWVAHMLLQAMMGKPITVYGDGCQVRDLLYVDDLIDAMLLVEGDAHRLRGRAFNVGGGPARSLSLVELLERAPELAGQRARVAHEDWRPGDQRWYASDTRRLAAATGWAPRTSLDEGLTRLARWLRDGVIASGRVPEGVS